MLIANALTDGEAIYFSSSSLALPESLVREAELNGEKKIATKEEFAAVSRRDYGSLRKLYVKTGNVSQFRIFKNS